MHATAHIGPNAILQHLPLLHSSLGPNATSALLAQAGLAQPPAAHGMVAQATVARFHNAVTQHLGARAPALQWAAGVGTGRYILANRIPRPAQALLRALPSAWGARLLTRAILQHAWTFAGSGQLQVIQRSPLVLGLHQNPLAIAAPPSHQPQLPLACCGVSNAVLGADLACGTGPRNRVYGLWRCMLQLSDFAASCK